MQIIQLTQGHVAFVDDADFGHVSQFNWYAMKNRRNVYAARGGGKGPVILLHRLILNVSDPNMHVDHIDGDGLNCSRSNLRLCTNQQNRWNQRKQLCTTSKYKGVVRQQSGKWRAGITFNNKLKHLGNFSSEIDAARAYDRAAFELFGEFACTNFPIQQEVLSEATSFGVAA